MQLKRLLVYLIGCIGSRTLLTYVAKTINPDYLPYMGGLALPIAIGFIYIYIFGSESADKQLEWTGDKTVWWNDLRIVHGINYLIFAILAVQKSQYAWMVLGLDVSIGLIAWIVHHTSPGKNRIFA